MYLRMACSKTKGCLSDSWDATEEIKVLSGLAKALWFDIYDLQFDEYFLNKASYCIFHTFCWLRNPIK